MTLIDFPNMAASADDRRAEPAQPQPPVPECLAMLHVQVGINNAATPAPPIAPTANTNMAITALASRLYLLGTLDMASSLITIPVPPPQTACLYSAPTVTLCMTQITFGILGPLRGPISFPHRLYPGPSEASGIRRRCDTRANRVPRFRRTRAATSGTPHSVRLSRSNGGRQ